MTQIAMLGGYVRRNVTVARGSWKWQDAFKTVAYEPRLNVRTGAYFWRSLPHLAGGKMPIAKWTAERRARYAWGSLHNKPAVVGGVNDYGNLFFVVD